MLAPPSLEPPMAVPQCCPIAGCGEHPATPHRHPFPAGLFASCTSRPFPMSVSYRSPLHVLLVCFGGGFPPFPPLFFSHTAQPQQPADPQLPSAPSSPPTPEPSGRDPSAHLLLFGRLPHRCGFASLRAFFFFFSFFFLFFQVVLGSSWGFFCPFFSRAGTFLPGSDQRCYVLSTFSFNIFYPSPFFIYYFSFFSPIQGLPPQPPSPGLLSRCLLSFLLVPSPCWDLWCYRHSAVTGRVLR